MSSIVETVTEIVHPILNKFQFELVEIEYVKEGKNYFLRVFIDKPGGIDIEDTALVSEELSVKLDEITPDPFPEAYFLEVSSPGAERPLKKESDYEQAVGEYINISLYQAIDGVKVFEGDLVKLSAESLTLNIRIKTREKEIEIERKNIAKARRAIKF
ncbi:MAG: ribosome maturation factor RimP [Streptococcaceae bacterium]|nr:ribosome maturation factor RimP [Streptococcaceae bacterium]